MSVARDEHGDRAGAGPLPRQDAEQLAGMLRTIGDPTRLQLLSIVLGSTVGEVSVGELTDQLGVSMPTVSHHLAMLVDAGVLVRERRGRYVWYAVSEDRRADLQDLLR